MVPSSELLDMITKNHPDVRKAPDELNDTARSYVIPGHIGSFGFISSMSDHFCGSCNRLRITADGQIKVFPHSSIFPLDVIELAGVGLSIRLH
jgi:cyclic pyranopterin phosphate synthase